MIQMRQKIVSDCRWKCNYYRLSYNIAGQAKGGIPMKILITGFEPFGGEVPGTFRGDGIGV